MKRWMTAALAALCIAAMAGCKKEAPPQDTRYPLTVGQTVLSSVPKRVVSLAPSLTDTMLTLGYGGRLAGVSDYCETPAEAGDLAACGSMLLPDLGAIKALSADLVLTTTELPPAAQTALAEADAAVLVIPYAETLDALYENWETICTAMEGAERGAFLGEQLRHMSETMLDYLAEQAEEHALAGEDAVYLRKYPFVIATGDTPEGEILERIGFVNQADAFSGWDYPPEEEPNLNPTWLFFDESVSEDTLQTSDYYRLTRAVTRGQTVVLEGLTLERQSPRLLFEWEDAIGRCFPEGLSAPRPDLAMEMPEPEPEPEPTWWEKLFKKK